MPETFGGTARGWLPTRGLSRTGDGVAPMVPVPGDSRPPRCARRLLRFQAGSRTSHPPRPVSFWGASPPSPWQPFKCFSSPNNQGKIVLSPRVLRPAEPCPSLNSEWGGGPPIPTPDKPPTRSGACEIWAGPRMPMALRVGSCETRWRKVGGRRLPCPPKCHSHGSNLEQARLAVSKSSLSTFVSLKGL